MTIGAHSEDGSWTLLIPTIPAQREKETSRVRTYLHVDKYVLIQMDALYASNIMILGDPVRVNLAKKI